MGTFTLQDDRASQVTEVPNLFLDYYMPSANGEFVKVYLYLLQAAGCREANVSLSSIADVFFCTETDVIRALKYWEKTGILALSFDNARNITGVRLCPLTVPDHAAAHTEGKNFSQMSTSQMTNGIDQSRLQPSERAAMYTETSSDAFAMRTAAAANSNATHTPTAADFSAMRTPTAADTSAMRTAAAANAAMGTAAATMEPVSAARETSGGKRPEQTKPKQLSSGRIKALKENDDIRQLLFLSERYLGRTLSPADINRLLYFYDELHFSAELLEYLVEYCVSKGSTSLHYIEKVGLAWHEAGITTVEMAKQETTTYNRKYFPILKAFGIRNRNPIPREIADMDRWLNSYGFSQEIIAEACTRTIAQTGQPSFSYAEGILSKWHSQNVRTLSDIQALDERHRKNQKSAAREASQQKPAAQNRFNNFHQREYDYEKLEQQLLNQ